LRKAFAQGETHQEKAIRAMVTQSNKIDYNVFTQNRRATLQAKKSLFAQRKDLSKKTKGTPGTWSDKDRLQMSVLKPECDTIG